jgi:hypothetical protein
VLPQFGDGPDAVGFQLLPQRLADTPDQIDGLPIQERLRLDAADRRQAARLVQVGRDLGQEFVVYSDRLKTRKTE